VSHPPDRFWRCNLKSGGAHASSVHLPQCTERKDTKDKKPKPVREESFSSKEFFERNDFSYVDRIVDPDRGRRDGPKGYPPSSIFMALLLMYLKSMESILELIRFLNTNPEWLISLKLKRRIGGKMTYKVPDRTTFYKFAERLGPGRIIEVFSFMIVRLIRMGVIKGEKVSLDCSIVWAWFKDCPSANKPNHKNRGCKKHRRRDRDASWTWDHHRERYVFGYKVHIAIDSLSGLPIIMLTVTKAGFGEDRTVAWFVRMLLRLSIPVKKFLADAGYDGYRTRLLIIIRRLKAIPFITLNPRNCEGNTHEEKMKRCKKLRHKWYLKNFLRRWWIDPDSEEFDREFDARTFSEQARILGRKGLAEPRLPEGQGEGEGYTTCNADLHCNAWCG
jgi:transposase